MRNRGILVVSLLLILSACGGSDSDSGSDPPEATTGATETTESAGSDAPSTTAAPTTITATAAPAPPVLNVAALVPVPTAPLDFTGQPVENSGLIWSVYSGSGGVIVENVGGPLPPGCHGTSFFDPATFALLQIDGKDLHAYASRGEGGCDNMQQDVEEGVVDGDAVKINTEDLILFDFGELPPPPFDVSTQIINPDGANGTYRPFGRNDPFWISEVGDATHVVSPGGLFDVDPDTGLLRGVDQPLPEPGPGCAEFLLCINDRFQVEITNGEGSPGSVLAADDLGGLMFFAGPGEWDALVRIVNGCDLNNSFWVFAAGSTNVEFELTVTDTATGNSMSYANPGGDLPEPILDTSAFATCP